MGRSWERGSGSSVSSSSRVSASSSGEGLGGDGGEALHFAKEGEEGACHQGGDKRHDDEHGEDARRENAEIVADIQRDELHEAAGVHERAEPEGIAPGHAGKAGGEGAAAEFAEGCDGDDEKADEPGLGVVEEAGSGYAGR